jgi:hypothetical protein
MSNNMKKFNLSNGFVLTLACTALVFVNAPLRAGETPPPKLPPLPKGVEELKFGDFFVTPVGPRGLELTDKLRQLDGRRVRLLGYMAQEESPVPGRFLLTPIPTQIHSHDNSLADDLPPSVVHVFPPTLRDERIPYSPQLMLLTGTLSVGNRDEADGRISIARLLLDPPEKAAKTKTRPVGKRFEKGAAGLLDRKAGGVAVPLPPDLSTGQHGNGSQPTASGPTSRPAI